MAHGSGEKQNNSRSRTVVQDRLLIEHWEVRSSSFHQQAAGRFPFEGVFYVPGRAVEHSVAGPCKRCVLAHGNGGPSQCDGREHPSHGNLLPLAVAGTQATMTLPRIYLGGGVAAYAAALPIIFRIVFFENSNTRIFCSK